MKKNLLGENILEPWEQEIADRINKKIKEYLEKQIKEIFKSHNFKI
nr:MAG TPA: hypothetical protein [Bacteriophage sp.]